VDVWKGWGKWWGQYDARGMVGSKQPGCTPGVGAKAMRTLVSFAELGSFIVLLLYFVAIAITRWNVRPVRYRLTGEGAVPWSPVSLFSS